MGTTTLTSATLDSVDPITAPGILTYTLTAANNGPSSATNVVVTDNLPSTVTFVSVASSQGSCAEAALVLTCGPGTIVTGVSATVTIEVIPNETGTLNNQAFVESQVGDPRPENDIDNIDTEVDIENRATFVMTNNYSDDNPLGVTVLIECNTGLPLQQQGVVHDPQAAGLQPGDFTVLRFVVNDFEPDTMDCDIEEFISCGLIRGNGNGGYCAQQFIDPNNPGVFEILPHFEGSTCSATEEPFTGVLTDESDCAVLIAFPGQGDSCMIVNTRLFAGIPTLNQYGLILLALMMLGNGALAYRRYA